jgi:prenyltransferase beta subunit
MSDNMYALTLVPHCLLLQPRSFSYCALLGCSILGRMDAINVPAAVRFVVACKNFDGGFGCTPGAHHQGMRTLTCWHLLETVLVRQGKC